jgi:hypothetical protein
MTKGAPAACSLRRHPVKSSTANAIASAKAQKIIRFKSVTPQQKIALNLAFIC